jgi:hypothetical protein
MHGPDDRIMYALNAWFRSPYLRNEVADEEKPLVMDLIFYLDFDDSWGSFANHACISALTF